MHSNFKRYFSTIILLLFGLAIFYFLRAHESLSAPESLCTIALPLIILAICNIIKKICKSELKKESHLCRKRGYQI